MPKVETKFKGSRMSKTYKGKKHLVTSKIHTPTIGVAS
jgi:hypothetical protein